MKQVSRLQVYQTMLADGMLPLFFHAELSTCRHIIDALVKGGVRCVEFTNRGANALATFSELATYCQQQHPQVILGVGSIEDSETAALFLAHGAQFVVSPTFNLDIMRLCHRRKVAHIPGCSTPTEIANAETAGAEIIKCFPANVLGPGFFKSVLAPRPWSLLMPTGGVSLEPDALARWFEAGAACVGVGGRLIQEVWLEQDNQDNMPDNMAALCDATRHSLETIAAIRGHLRGQP
jgi:2-dehydro-3-deoxyphosphogluconate aldolase/(4S)-4-hydroxy-2-oxoglutarate aldolase